MRKFKVYWSDSSQSYYLTLPVKEIEVAVMSISFIWDNYRCKPGELKIYQIGISHVNGFDIAKLKPQAIKISNHSKIYKVVNKYLFKEYSVDKEPTTMMSYTTAWNERPFILEDSRRAKMWKPVILECINQLSTRKNLGVQTTIGYSISLGYKRFEHEIRKANEQLNKIKIQKDKRK